MSPRLILFDIDGTLIDTAGAGRRAMERAFHDVFRIDGVSESAAGVRFAGMTDPLIFKAVARASDIDDEAFEAHRARLIQDFLAHLGTEMQQPNRGRRILPGVETLLSALESRDGVHLGLVTGNLEQGARIKLAAFDLNRYFPLGGFASDSPHRPEIARVAHRRVAEASGISFPPDHVTVVGDTEHDVTCARANRFRSVAVDSGWVRRRELEQANPTHLLDDFTDLARALETLDVQASC